MPAKSFYEVLEEQLRQDLRSEIEAEVREEMARKSSSVAGANQTVPTGSADLAGRFESLLASQIGKIVFPKVTVARHAYKAAPTTARKEAPKAEAPKTPAMEPTFTAITVEQLCAIEMIKRHASVRLDSTFTLKQLKAAWRKAALATHPDRFVGEDEVTRMRATAKFRELVEAYELLTTELALEAA